MEPLTALSGPARESLAVANQRLEAESAAFERLRRRVDVALRRSLVAHYGHERGREAYAEAMAYAWEHHERLAAFDNPTAYLFRVGQSRTRLRRWGREERDATIEAPDAIEPGLLAALRSLSRRQRTCVVLCVAYQWSHAEVADLLGISKPTVQKHVERGLTRVRSLIGEEAP